MRRVIYEDFNKHCATHVCTCGAFLSACECQKLNKALVLVPMGCQRCFARWVTRRIDRAVANSDSAKIVSFCPGAGPMMTAGQTSAASQIAVHAKIPGNQPPGADANAFARKLIPPRGPQVNDLPERLDDAKPTSSFAPAASTTIQPRPSSADYLLSSNANERPN